MKGPVGKDVMMTNGSGFNVLSVFALLVTSTLMLGSDVALADDLRRASEPFDMQGCIDAQIAAGKKHIVVPPGSYRVTPRARQHLILRGLTDVTIVADGVEMICTQTTRALTVADCRNLTVRGLVIDYDPLPYTQGRIVTLSEDSLVHEIELFDGYPPAGARSRQTVSRPPGRKPSKWPPSTGGWRRAVPTTLLSKTM